MTKEVSDLFETPNKITERKLASIRARIKQTLKDAIRRGTINFLVIPMGQKNARIRLFTNLGCENIHFAEAVTRDSIHVDEIDKPDSPWEIPIDAPEVKIEQIAKNLPSFIYDFYAEEVRDLPIYIFRTVGDYRQNRPASIVEFAGNLLTLKSIA